MFCLFYILILLLLVAESSESLIRTMEMMIDAGFHLYRRFSHIMDASTLGGQVASNAPGIE